MKVVAIFLGLVVASQAVSFFDLVLEEWSTFKLTHRKKYDDSIEEKFRMKIFMENKNKIAKHNKKYELGLVSYKMALNKYGDMLPHEFKQTLNGFKPSLKLVKSDGDNEDESGATFIEPANVEIPNEVDWRTLGAVTPVKDQGHCGSCWSFSATGALEGQHFRKNNELVSLSEQNLIDCSKKFGNNGCNGGLMDLAFKYIKKNGGIDTEKSYPYKADDEKCHYKKANSGATDAGFVDIPSGDEKKLKAAIATIGPCSVAIDASHESFQFYSEGVYYEPECSAEELDHGVLAVGYGTDEAGLDYWLIKNSWGESWGQKGYIKMARNKKNHCGVATQASYPLV